MIVRHHLTITAECPVDGKPDRYDAVIECGRVVKVEDILALATLGRMYQEEVTVHIARTLGVKVTTTGYHSGVKTICECS